MIQNTVKSIITYGSLCTLGRINDTNASENVLEVKIRRHSQPRTLALLL